MSPSKLSLLVLTVCATLFSAQTRSVDLSASDLESWMTDLPQTLKETPIIYLAIPGSHDTGTYAITNTSEIAPDADDVIKELGFLGSFLTDIMARWSLTQEYTISQQLVAGIRYLDLRIATRNDTDQFFFVHSLYSAEVGQDLRNINDFLDSHPQEVVILDCQHFYALTDADHQRFKDLLTSTFGQKLLPYSSDITQITLQSMTSAGHQVIVVYREAPGPLESTFWPSESLPNPWANTMSVSYLIDYLTDGLRNRDNNVGFVSQCILTPETDTILQHLGSDLKTESFDPLEEDKYSWLSNQKPGPGGLNIIISDFVEFEGDEFARAVIALNEKLL